MNNITKKQKKLIHFETETLEKLEKSENSCVIVQNLKKHLNLHPYHLNDINESLKDVILKNVGRFDRKLGGILLGYKNATIEGAASMYDENCFIYVDVHADFYLFKPDIDKLVSGVVIKKTADHIGVLVHDAFNVSVPKTDDEWKGYTINLGQEILMKITHTNFESRLPFIKAELMEILSEGTQAVPSSNKKIHFTYEEDENEVEQEEIVIEVPEKKKKVKKRRKTICSDVPDETPKREINLKEKRKRSISECFNGVHDSADEFVKPPKKAKRIENYHEVEQEPYESSKKKRKRSKSESFANLEEDIEEEPKKKKRRKNSEADDLKAIMMKAASMLNNITGKGQSKKDADDLEKMKLLLSEFNAPEETKKSKKKKHKDSELESEEKRHKRKTKKEKVSQELSDLNLDHIFNNEPEWNFNKSSIEMADAEDKGIMKRRNSTAIDIDWTDHNLSLPPDSDLEKILGSNTKKHKKHKRKSCDV